MKQSIKIAALLVLLSAGCADEKKNPEQKNDGAVPKIEAARVITFDTRSEDLLKDFMTWYTYTYSNIRLGQDFIGLNADSGSLRKDEFLQLLKSGKYFAIRIMEKEGIPVYRLFNDQKQYPAMRSTMIQMAETEIEHQSQVGKDMPTFRFKDLEGRLYTNENTIGKILVLKCWFINCVACVKEFPELNELTASYGDRKDVLFVSLATDESSKLKQFLASREFSYAVVPGQGNFMKDLGVTSYPKHFIIGRDGRIANVSGNATDLIPALKKEIGQL